MKSPEVSDAEFFRKRFPTLQARLKADRAADALPVTATMAEHLDCWIAAYRAAGGREPRYKD